MRKEKEETKENKSEDMELSIDHENSVKITVDGSAADGLKELVSKINDGFSAGRVHRQDVASWIIHRFIESHAESDLHQIRAKYYDDSAMLEAMYRRMKATGQVPDFLRDALRKEFQVQPDASKRSKKALTSRYINDVPLSHEDAA